MDRGRLASSQGCCFFFKSIILHTYTLCFVSVSISHSPNVGFTRYSYAHEGRFNNIRTIVWRALLSPSLSPYLSLSPMFLFSFSMFSLALSFSLPAHESHRQADGWKLTYPEVCRGCEVKNQGSRPSRRKCGFHWAVRICIAGSNASMHLMPVKRDVPMVSETMGPSRLFQTSLLGVATGWLAHTEKSRIGPQGRFLCPRLFPSSIIFWLFLSFVKCCAYLPLNNGTWKVLFKLLS